MPLQLEIVTSERTVFSGEADMVTVPGGGGIMGVHSASGEAPIKSGNFDAADAAFDGATKYADWQFLYVPPKPAESTAAPTAKK